MNLDKLVVVFISILFVFFGCGSSGQSKYNLNHADIIGKWVIQHIDKIKDPALLTPSDSSKDLITLFGPQIWSLAEGKQWTFLENGVLKTNIHINDPTFSPEMAEWARMSEEIDFGYKLDSTLTILMNFEDQLVYESPVEIISLDPTEMIWDIEGFYKVTLIKVKK